MLKRLIIKYFRFIKESWKKVSVSIQILHINTAFNSDNKKILSTKSAYYFRMISSEGSKLNTGIIAAIIF